MRRALPTLLLLLVTTGLCLLLAEAIARHFVADAYYIWPPRLERTFEVQADIVAGIHGVSRFTTNSFGVRGPEYSGVEKARWLAVGGSTTICIYLDDSETWPALVQRGLNAEWGEGAVWVGNVGRAGHTTRQHRLQLQEFLPRHPEIDGVLLLVGANDMLIPLHARGEAPVGPEAAAIAAAMLERELRSPPSDAALQAAFADYPGWDGDGAWYWRTALGRLWRTLRLGVQGQGQPSYDRVGRFLEGLRERRRHATSIQDELPDLGPALARYRRMIGAIIDVVQGQGVRPVFITQPALWRAGLGPSELDRLWCGGGPLGRPEPAAEYLSAEALARAMELYNEALLDVCRERGVECLDAAARLPRDGSVFYDDLHLTERGARLLADLVAEHLLRTGAGRNPAAAPQRSGSPERPAASARRP